MKSSKYSGITIGDLQVPMPVMQGGMGIGVSGRNLAVSVAKAGGIGLLSAVGLGYVTKIEDEAVIDLMNKNSESSNVAAMRQEIRRAKKETTGAIGVNIMVALTEFKELAKAAIEEKIDLIVAGAGLPLNLPELLIEGSKTKLVPIISSARAATFIAKRWITKYNYAPDAFVLEGPLAGGHLGYSREQIDNEEYQLENLLPGVLEAVSEIEKTSGKKIPVIAAGGIHTAEDINQILDMGAGGVQMGTRFVATVECDADVKFKEAYVNCKKEDIVIIESPVGLPGRALAGDFVEEAKAGLRRPKACNRECITTCKRLDSMYCISSALINAYRGRINNGFVFVGAKAYLIDKIVTVQELFDELFEKGR